MSMTGRSAAGEVIRHTPWAFCHNGGLNIVRYAFLPLVGREYSMSDRLQSFENDVRKLMVDLIGIPVILFWGGLSLMPLGMLFSGDVATLRYWINVFFLGSGLWGVLVLYFGARLLMWSEASATIEQPARIVIASFAGVWCVLYLAFFFSSR
jgi:hypothetical protein